MIRVAMVNTEKTRGGAARMAAALNEAVNNSGLSVVSTLYHSQNNERDELSVGLKKPGSRYLNALLARLGGSTCVYDFGMAKEITQSLETVDVLHIHNLHGYYLNWASFLSLNADKPIVWTLHDMWAATGRCGNSHECRRWLEGCGNCPDLGSPPAAWFDRSNYEYEAKTALFAKLKNIVVVSPSEWLAEVARRRGVPAKAIEVIPNPVNTSHYRFLDKLDARRRCNLRLDEFTIMFIASDCGDPRKGYEDFCFAAANTSAQAIVVGSPPSVRLSNTVYTGQLGDSSRLNQYYAAADLMVIPSYAENYPNTVIESIASGTPVLGYEEGGIPSQIAGIPNCTSVMKGDKRALRTALLEAIDRGGKTEAISRAISDEAHKRWSSVNVAARYVDIYRQVLEPRQ